MFFLIFSIVFVLSFFLVNVDGREAEGVCLTIRLRRNILESDCHVDGFTYWWNVSSELLRDIDLPVDGLGKSVSLS